MILNKKGLAVLPLAALLFTSCSPWKGISYEKAKEFIDTNYKLDGAKALYPTKVHEKFNATAADAYSVMAASAMAAMGDFFYSSGSAAKLEWTKEAPYKCNYEGDYVPDEGQMFDFPLLPIATQDGESITDVLMQSNKDAGLTVTYQVNGKMFKQNMSGKSDITNMSKSNSYNEKGYRFEVTGKCSAKGEGTDSEGKKVKVDFSFEYHGVYTYAE